MIEIVYKDENEETNEEANANVTVKTPKNIKQIGDGESSKKIYIEDYVMNFVKQTPKETDGIKYGILLGEIKKGNGNTYLFISGGVEVKESIGTSIIFNGDVWTEIYEEIRRYFNHLEIVGWFASFPFDDRTNDPAIRKNHLDNFAGSDKVFLCYDRTENEEGFYIYESGVLSKQDSYYIYYERNEQMQEYLVDNNISSKPEASPVKKREGSYRALIMEAKEQEKEQPFKKLSKLKPINHNNLKEPEKVKEKINIRPVKKMPSLASSLFIILLLIAVIGIMNNYNKMSTLKTSMANIADDILGNGNNNTDDNLLNEEETVQVETVNGNVQPTDQPTTAATETTTAVQETTAAIQQTTAAAAQQKTYTVQEGESLYSICRQLYNSTSMVATIIQLNNLSSPDDIQPGQKLLLPY